MAIFGVVVEDNETAKTFFKEVRERITTDNLARSPFIGGVTSFISLRKHKDEKETKVDLGYTIKMAPIYFNFALLGFFFMVAAFIIWPRLSIAIAGAVFLLVSLGWSGRFYFFMLKLGLKKKGYKGSIRYLKPAEILEEVYFNGNK